ncbi:hypothetical protein GCM10025860_20210 [Methanobacterium ferruginis]|nr:hypothetical protein GCM10025860_20210 [Methanobacterium ferruginis]
MLIIFAPLLFAGGIALGIVFNNFWFGLGGAVSTVFPILVIFLRIKTFSDDSIPVYAGPKMSIPLDIGYFPFFYWILSAMLGFQVTGRGFSTINTHFTTGNPSLKFSFIAIILGLIMQTIVLFPDKFDRIVPLDLRTKKGFIFMIALTVALYTTSYLILSLFNSNLVFQLY